MARDFVRQNSGTPFGVQQEFSLWLPEVYAGSDLRILSDNPAGLWCVRTFGGWNEENRMPHHIRGGQGTARPTLPGSPKIGGVANRSKQ
jgi:hypothetical protein